MFSPLMVDTWIAATVVAAVAGVVGFFTVLRGSAFAAHALPQSAFAGAAAATLAGVSPLLGLGAFAAGGAAFIGLLGRRGRHDVATGLTVVLLLGLGDLLLSRTSGYSGVVYALLFGEVLGVSRGELIPLAGMALAGVAVVGIVFRPLLLASTLPEAAEARGVSPRRMELVFLLTVALATSTAVPVVGALLIFTLLVAPAAAARSLTDRPAAALALSVVMALATVWAAIAASFFSNLPVGFFVGSFSAVAYAAGRILSARRRRADSRLPAPRPAVTSG